METIHGDDLVALVPHQLGFEPESSLVLVLMRARAPHAAELGLMIRVDLPPEQAETMGAATAWQIAGLSRAEPDADAAVLVFFHPAGRDTEEGETYGRAARLIGEALEGSHGILVRACLWATAGAWGHVGDAEVRPRAESAATTRLLVEGSAPTASVHDLCRLPEVGPRVSVVRAEWDGAGDREVADLLRRDVGALLRMRGSGPRPSDARLDTLVAAEGLPSERTAAVLAEAVRHLPTRDSILAALGDPAQWDGRVPSDGSGIVGLETRRPDLTGLGLGVAYARRWAAFAARSGRPCVAALAILAWLEWSRMRMSWSAEYLRVALAEDPDYGLAVLLSRAMESGLRPAWMTGRAGATRTGRLGSAE